MVTNVLRALRGVKRQTAVFAMFAVCAAVFAISTFAQIKTVTLNVDGKDMTFKTWATSVESVLKQNDIAIDENDEIVPPLTSDLSTNMTITVKHAFDVPFVIGTESFTVKTVSKTVDAFLKSEGVILGEYDLVNPSLDTVINKGMSVNISRVSKVDYVETEIIPFGKQNVPNPDMERGESRVKQNGINGEKEVVYNVTVTNGEETEKVFVGERVVTEPTDEIVEYGTKSITPVSRGKASAARTNSGAAASAPRTNSGVADAASTFAGSSFIDCKAYSYDIHGRTATGMATQRGLIAVDPRVIPLGTKVYVQSLDGKPDYGYAIAADTGGSIKGNIIDMWYPTYAECAANGVRRMRVYILS